mgnify:CR=1 FL=1
MGQHLSVYPRPDIVPVGKMNAHGSGAVGSVVVAHEYSRLHDVNEVEAANAQCSTQRRLR